jgi:RecA/RadA recombinase
MSEESFEELLSAINNKFGTNVAKVNVKKGNQSRSSTGIFPLDYCLGGGLPDGRVSSIYGRESSGKSCIALKSLAAYQKNNPDKRAVLLDVEGHYDSEWASKLGVDTKALVVVRADYAEMYVDSLDGILNHEHVGMVVLDSIAAFSPKVEMDDSAEQSHMGRVSQIQSVMVRKTEQTLNKMARDYGYAPPVLILNQARANYDKKNKYSPDDKPSGARSLFHAGVLLAKASGFPIKDPKSTNLPLMNEITFTIQRAKMKTLNKGITFKFVLEDHGAFRVGDIADEAGFIISQLESIGLMTRPKKGGYELDGETYKTQKQIKDKLHEDFAYSSRIKKSIIDYRLQESVLT